jgi:hypothetical protein
VLACAAASPEKRELKHRTQLWNVVTVEGNLERKEDTSAKISVAMGNFLGNIDLAAGRSHCLSVL